MATSFDLKFVFIMLKTLKKLTKVIFMVKLNLSVFESDEQNF